MSQNPNNDPNYNPYEQNPSNPGYPGSPYSGSQPPMNPASAYGYPLPNPPAVPDPNSNYGPYANPYQPGAAGAGTGPNPYSSETSMPTVPSTGPNAYMPGPSSAPGMPSTGPNPYNSYASGVQSPYTSYPPTPGAPLGFSPLPTPRRRGRGLTVLIVIIALLVIIGGVLSGVVINNNHQNALHASATSTALAHIKGTADAQGTASAQQTAVASVYPFSNTLLLNDPLTDNSKGVNWDNDGTYCHFTNGVYHAYDNQSNTYQPCSALNSDFSNFTLEVQMTITQGGTGAAGGVIFRGNEASYKYYHITVDATGYYYVLASVDASGSSGNERTLSKGTTQLLTTGLGQSNLIAVVANGDQISFYINKQKVVTVEDSTYTHGQIGFEADNNGSNADVTYSNLKVWGLPV